MEKPCAPSGVIATADAAQGKGYGLET